MLLLLVVTIIFCHNFLSESTSSPWVAVLHNDGISSVNIVVLI